MALTLVDLDGTLLSGPSSEKRFVFHLLRQRRLGLRQLSAYLGFVQRWGPVLGRAVWKKNKAYLAGLPQGDVAALARGMARDRLVPALFPPMLRRLEDHRARGDELLLLTGTLDVIARPLAEHLGIPNVRATRCAASAGRLLADPPLEHPLGAAKRRIAAAEAARRSLPLAAVTAYGDAFSDLALLAAVGRPVAVRPCRRLRREAQRRGWEVLEE